MLHWILQNVTSKLRSERSFWTKHPSCIQQFNIGQNHLHYPNHNSWLITPLWEAKLSLFVWLASIMTHFHLNCVHDNGIWMSHTSKAPDLRDTLLVITETHFLAVTSQTRCLTKMEIHDGFCNPDDTCARFTYKPFILWHPVKDVKSRCSDIGITTIGSPHPMQHLLVELCGLPTIQYRIHLVAWLKRNIAKLNFVHS